MAYGTINADQIGTSVANTSLGAGNSSLMKNKIINGAMVIDQRNAGASVTPTTNTYTLDRWQAYTGGLSSKFSVQQNAGSVTPPAGYINYLGVTSLSSYTSGASDYLAIVQNIEGLNCTDLGWGTANAKTVTLSFWVRSSLTGTFGGSLLNSAYNRSYPFTYTISSANTWTQASVTIAGDTTGTWLTTNGVGIRIWFNLGTGSSLSGTAGAWAAGEYENATGSVAVTATNGATLYITGVQLEVGSSATGFEYVNYQTSLANCQRYYEVFGRGGVGGSRTSALFTLNFGFAVSKRATPTIAQTTTFSIFVPSVAGYTANSISASYPNTSGTQIDFTMSGGSTGVLPALYGNGSATDVLTASAEL
jgi:hypothetical protein